MSNSKKKLKIDTPSTQIADRTCSIKDDGVKQIVFVPMRRIIAIAYVVMLNCMVMALSLRDDNQ
jgi:hypothetical protein